MRRLPVELVMAIGRMLFFCKVFFSKKSFNGLLKKRRQSFNARLFFLTTTARFTQSIGAPTMLIYDAHILRPSASRETLITHLTATALSRWQMATFFTFPRTISPRDCASARAREGFVACCLFCVCPPRSNRSKRRTLPFKRKKKKKASIEANSRMRIR